MFYYIRHVFVVCLILVSPGLSVLYVFEEGNYRYVATELVKASYWSQAWMKCSRIGGSMAFLFTKRDLLTKFFDRIFLETDFNMTGN